MCICIQVLSCNKHSIKLPKTVIFTFVFYLPRSSETTMATQEKTTQEQHSYTTGWPSPHRNALFGPEINAANFSPLISQPVIQMPGTDSFSTPENKHVIMNPSTILSLEVKSNLFCKSSPPEFCVSLCSTLKAQLDKQRFSKQSFT